MEAHLARKEDAPVTIEDVRRELPENIPGLDTGFLMRMLTSGLWTVAKEDFSGEPEHYH